MKFLSILAAASLALTPVIASADSHPDTSPPLPGGAAGRVLDKQVIPYGAVAAGGLLIFGGAIFCLLECDSGSSGDKDSQVDTNNGTVD